LSQQDTNEYTGPARSSAISLPASLDAPALARLHLKQFRAELTPPVFDDALILTSELVTNAVLHGKPDITLSITLHIPNLTVAVSDGSSRLPPTTTEFPLRAAPHGRGLAIVDSIATRWGVTRHVPGPGKDVWFLLEVS
jgi:anti-sigma regulatory factor (Ser/Thr protein kinase)